MTDTKSLQCLFSMPTCPKGGPSLYLLVFSPLPPFSNRALTDKFIVPEVLMHVPTPPGDSKHINRSVIVKELKCIGQRTSLLCIPRGWLTGARWRQQGVCSSCRRTASLWLGLPRWTGESRSGRLCCFLHRAVHRRQAPPVLAPPGSQVLDEQPRRQTRGHEEGDLETNIISLLQLKELQPKHLHKLILTCELESACLP
jgi:hypothetical protein